MVSKNMYDSLRQKCIDLAKLKEAKYYKDKFEKYDYSQKTLFKFAEIFLDQSPELILPSTEDIQTVVNEFNSYFTDKIPCQDSRKSAMRLDFGHLKVRLSRVTCGGETYCPREISCPTNYFLRKKRSSPLPF